MLFFKVSFSQFMVFFFILFGIQIGSEQCSAESIWSYVIAEYHTDYHDGGELIRKIAEEETTAQGQLVEIINTSGNFIDNSGSYQVNGLAKTFWGFNHVQAKVKVNNANKETVWLTAISRFEDDWIVRGPGPSGGRDLCFGVYVSGNSGGSDNDSNNTVNNSLTYRIKCSGSGCNYSSIENIVNIDEYSEPFSTVTGCINVDYDKFFTISSQLYVQARIGKYEEGSITGEAYLDFGQTAAITTLTLPEGAVLTTASGATYPVDYTPPGLNSFSWGMFLPAIIGEEK